MPRLVMPFVPAPLPWTPTIPLIGLGYRAGAGKDTVADYLVKKHGFVKFAFAGALKQTAKDLCGFTEAQVNGSLAEKEEVDPRWGFSPRFLLQQMGTQVVRSIDADFWVKVMDQKLRTVVLEQETHCGDSTCDAPHAAVMCGGVVISDMRFPNELAAIRAWGGYAVEVYRPLAAERNDAHASETSLEGAQFDDRIVNASSLPQLYEQVDGMKWNLKMRGRK